MSTDQLLRAVLEKAPQADPETVLDLIVSCNADLNKVYRLLGVNSISSKRQLTFKVSKPSPHTYSKSSNGLKKLPGRNQAEVIDLFTPQQVADAGIYCTMHTNVLEAGISNELLTELLQQSPGWSKGKFYLFDRLVESPHSSFVYAGQEYLDKVKGSTYQGRTVKNMGVFSPVLKQSTSVIQDLVNLEIARRNDENPLKPWVSELAIANLYQDRNENVGWHSDQLTHLGPEPVIAGLSLGATREFRLRLRHEKHVRRIYSIHVPHNALIIMHAGCQELFKHSIVPARSITPHPLSGSARISITYRMYPEEYRTEKVPRCKCGEPMLLRSTLEENYKYIWQCAAHYSDNKGCGETRIVNVSLPIRRFPA